MVRASRRGEVTGPNSTFYAPTGPGDTGGTWGQGYDSSQCLASVGVFPYTPGVPSLPIRNSASGVFPNLTASPHPETYVQVADPASAPLPVVASLFPASNPHYTTQIAIMGIAGPDSYPGAPNPSPWSVVVAGGVTTPYLKSYPSIMMKGPISNPTPTPWTLLNPTPLTSPQPCTGGPCDTDQNTIPAVVYGTNPDQYAPYITLDTPAGSNWALVTGAIQDTSGNGLPGVPVSIHDPLAQFADIEKTTNASGAFKMLVPAPGNMTFTINSQTPAPGIPQNTHYYNPHFVTVPIVVPITPANPGDTISFPAVNLAVNPLVNNAAGQGNITGTITSVELDPVTNLPTPLARRVLELRNPNGYVILTAATDANGNYTFAQIPSNTYYLTPVTEFRETTIPYKSPLIIVPLSGTVSGPTTAFQIRGVPALVTVSDTNAGTYVLVYGTSGVTGFTNLPPAQSRTNAQRMYSAVIPGGPQGAVYTSPPIPVPPGLIYNVTCWKPDPISQVYNRSAGVTQVNGGVALAPNSRSPVVACP